MQEAYKEMYVHLYKNMAVLLRVLEKLCVKVDDTLTDSINIPLAQLDEQFNDKDDIKKQFQALFETL